MLVAPERNRRRRRRLLQPTGSFNRSSTLMGDFPAICRKWGAAQSVDDCAMHRSVYFGRIISALVATLRAQPGQGIMKAAFHTTLAIVVLLPAAALGQSGGWQPNGSGMSTWHVSPSEGTCNVSQAQNRARRAGIYRTDLVYRDENVLTLRGLTEWGDRREITFANIRGCPEVGFQDMQQSQPGRAPTNR